MGNDEERPPKPATGCTASCSYVWDNNRKEWVLKVNVNCRVHGWDIDP